MTNLISHKYERRCFNDDFHHRNSQYWRYLFLPPRQKAKLSTKTCIRCKSIPTTCKICTRCKILREVGFFVYRGSFRFRFALSTRAHGVPFLHTSGAHLTTPFHGAIAVGAKLPPTPPSIRLHSLVKHIQKKAPIRLAVWVFRCKFATAIYSRKTHTSTFIRFCTQNLLKVLCAKRGFTPP